jgi:histidine triad (HIT) family protein
VNQGEKPMDKKCIFCNIIAGRTDTQLVFEDDHLVVFKDINPHAPVHDLIVPRRHIRSINDLTPNDQDIVSKMIMAGRNMAKQRGINESGYKLVYNVEWGGGQRIFHLHMHLIGGWDKK